jgi:hypothetical protein
MLHPQSGIGEHTEVTADQPDIVELIQRHLKHHQVTERYYNIPPQN